jgi:hypothetical protein
MKRFFVIMVIVCGCPALFPSLDCDYLLFSRDGYGQQVSVRADTKFLFCPKSTVILQDGYDTGIRDVDKRQAQQTTEEFPVPTTHRISSRPRY